ncbi:MAG: toprim domain-containing protein [Methyloglobulus sp.]
MNNIQNFTDALIDKGIVPARAIIADGLLHRAPVEGDKAGTLNLAYVLHLDGTPTGWFHHFKTGVTGSWSASGKREPMTAAMRKQLEYAREVRQQEQAKAHQDAAQKAYWIWGQSEPITDPSRHPYLARKCINPHSARLYKGALVIPIYDEANQLVNLQFINADGTKRFLSGGRKKGCCSIIGETTETILVCEGWATGASLHEATGHYVIVAMDAGNLKPVGEIVRSQYPTAKIIACADNDPVGIEKATVAAFACNGLMIAPPTEGTDFNDFINSGGVVYG